MKGIIAVAGMALATTHLLRDDAPDVSLHRISSANDELVRFSAAVAQASSELATLMQGMQGRVDGQTVEIFDFQQLMLEDSEFVGRMRTCILNEQLNCEYAIDMVAREHMEHLAAMDNSYLSERTADVDDLRLRLLRALLGAGSSNDPPTGPFIVVASDLAPTKLVEFDRELLRGVVLDAGGLSSHCVILARSMGIPCIIGIKTATASIADREQLLLDAIQGEVTPSPSDDAINIYKQYQVEQQKNLAALEQYKQAPTITQDGYRMRVFANITAPAEVEALLLQGGEGVGLLRTEMLYMEQRQPPDEDRQYKQYAAIAAGLQGRPLIIRTLDVGGDKEIGYLGIPKEENPFLGYRAIRYCLDHPDIFKTQLAAILHASVAGNVQLMLPMITGVEEIRRARVLLEETKLELSARQIPYNPSIKVGIMVETPAAAEMVDRLATMVDFFSIGTNDLTQYLFAADRNNLKVAGVGSYYHPALLRTVRRICKAAHTTGIEVDICGQAGELALLVPLWVAMGVDNLSVSIPAITRVRRLINNLSQSRCQVLLEHVIQLDTAAEVQAYLEEEQHGS